MKRFAPEEQRVLITASDAREASRARDVLRQANLLGEVCESVERLREEVGIGAGALLLTEEVITTESVEPLLDMLSDQPPWSDLPIVVLTSGGEAEETSLRLLNLFGPVANVTLLERPMRPLTLATAIKVALRARRRQYQVRDLLIQRESDLARVKAAQKEAVTANQAKDHFLATLSHELRLPLTPVLLTLSSMADDPEIPGSVREQVEFMRRNVQLEARLIDDLLDLTRIARGKLALEFEPVDVHAQLRHAATICRGANPGGAPIHLDLQAVRHRAWGDRTRIQQVFWNVLANAIKFTPPSGQIQVRTRNASDDRITIEIADNGIGIDPDELPRIFGAFEQGGKGVTRTFGGLGLGLAITKSLVEMHHGTIEASSPGKGHGAVFTLTLPALAVSEEVSEPRLPAVLRRTLRVLLVEDHEATLSAISRLLRREGHEVVTASSVGEAVDAAKAERFDILVCDLGLPDRSGIELIRYLRSNHYLGPAIALSGLGMEEDIQASRRAGFDRHLVKPVDWHQLRATIAEIVEGRIGTDGSQTGEGANSPAKANEQESDSAARSPRMETSGH